VVVGVLQRKVKRDCMVLIAGLGWGRTGAAGSAAAVAAAARGHAGMRGRGSWRDAGQACLARERRAHPACRARALCCAMLHGMPVSAVPHPAHRHAHEPRHKLRQQVVPAAVHAEAKVGEGHF
jgi:hypothetical protein